MDYLNGSSNYTEIITREKQLFNYLIFGTYVTLFAVLYYITISNNHPIREIVLFFLFSIPLVLLTFGIFTQRKTFAKSKFKSAETFFTELGYEKLVARYSILLYHRRDSIRILIMASTLFGIFLIWVSFFANYEKGAEGQKVIHQITTISFILLPTIIPYSLHVIKNRFTLWGDFEFFHAYGCFLVSNNSKNLPEEVKSRLIINGLNSYNSYLRNNINAYFTNIEQVYLKIISASPESMTQMINEMVGTLRPENKLEFLRYLQSLDEQKLILVQDKISRKIQEWSPIILGPLVPIIIFVITVAMGKIQLNI